MRQNLLCRLLVVSAIAITIFGRAANAAEKYPLRDAEECHRRAGLANFQAKLEAGKDVKIAYLGGSITAAPGWRVLSRQWFQQQYPKVKVEEIHAAIGGTGSDLGVFRLRNDVLRHQPDLLFVEFAVNDGGAKPDRIQKAMEGIVRQTWKANPEIDICFVYTLSSPVLRDLQNGKMQRSASAMEELADHYQIPSIHFGVKVVEMEAAGDLVFKAPKPENLADTKPMVFSTDGVHPHVETGHRVYTDAIARSWPALKRAGTKPGPHAMVKPLRADHWEQAKQIPITPEMLQGEWQKLSPEHALSKRFGRNMPELYQAKKAGAALAFTFEGTTAAVFDILGPDGGRLSVQLDDREATKRNRIDGYCTYHRMSKLAIANEIEPGRHVVKITLLPDRLDKRAILFERNRAVFDRHEQRFEGQVWYVGSLLVIGDVVVRKGGATR